MTQMEHMQAVWILDDMLEGYAPVIARRYELLPGGPDFLELIRKMRELHKQASLKAAD